MDDKLEWCGRQTLDEAIYRDPSAEELNSALFEAIWQAIKKWDISRTSNGIYEGATGTDVVIIIDRKSVV